ncbi:YaaA family protein [Ornithinimicrobium sp. Y1847]|uniref:YaaA family protein n=1 Tax=unclassified Ornithinimicrobium TaxID=2615080 RepID=UPI003B68549F
MLILLPPSESKATRSRGSALRWDGLSCAELTSARQSVAAALAQVSRGEYASEVLGVSPNLGEEIARNTRLAQAPTLEARDLYTGVLYDALDLPGLDSPARRRATSRLRVVSALYGVVRMTDRLAPYRLSMAVTLPEVGRLASFWKPHLEPVLTAEAGAGLVIDCRSSTYAAAWVPTGSATERWVQVRVPGATHMAKHTRGLVARALCVNAADPRRPEAMVEILAERFEVELHAPQRIGRPWILDVQPA